MQEWRWPARQSPRVPLTPTPETGLELFHAADHGAHLAECSLQRHVTASRELLAGAEPSALLPPGTCVLSSCTQ